MAERWAAATAAASPPRTAATRAPRPDRRLRIGYVSGDFRNHAVANFLLPVLEAHDRAAVEVLAYSANAASDAITARFRALADRWVDAFALDDAALTARVAADGVDVLVDLAGHTRHERLAAFRARPAPVQLTWIGFAATTGLDCFDARVTDALADPPGLTEAHFTEPLERLAPGFLAYRPVEALPSPTPGPAERPMTFGSFASAAKINRRTLRLWARALAAVPGARLLLKPPAADNQLVAEELRRMAHEAGIAPERLELRRPVADWKDQFAAYADIDAVLDTAPYAGTTTTCEALWMGVPVATLAGATHASRVGASLLTRAGLAELVAPDEDGFVAVARVLAAAADRRRAWRDGLRAQVAGSALGDPVAVTRAFEALCRRLRRDRGDGAEGLGVPAQIA
jgi:predicted O-linked N-acetylglucosamine transferase (SPINDLY family)